MAKEVAYTPEMSAAIVAAYMAVRDEAEDVRDRVCKELAAKHGKDIRSIRAKLAREVIPGTTERVYVAKSAKAKDGSEAINKEKLVLRLRTVSGLNLSDNLVNAPKEDLKAILAAFEALKAEAEAETAEAETAEAETAEAS